jgi:hypothetical protein
MRPPTCRAALALLLCIPALVLCWAICDASRLITELDTISYAHATKLALAFGLKILACAACFAVVGELWLSCAPRKKTRCTNCRKHGTELACVTCNWPQWKRLPARHRVVSIFAAVSVLYRWQIMGAVFPLLLAAAATLVLQVNGRERSERDASLSEARKASEAMYRYRGALLTIETTCGKGPPAECWNAFNDFRESYHRVSWELPSVLGYFHEKVCSEADQSKGTKTMCRFMRINGDERLIDRLNAQYRAYVNRVAMCWPGHGEVSCGRDRRRHAEVLYENGRIVGCAIAEAIYHMSYFGARRDLAPFKSCTDPTWRVYESPCPSLTCSEYAEPLRWHAWPHDDRPPSSYASECADDRAHAGSDQPRWCEGSDIGMLAPL